MRGTSCTFNALGFPDFAPFAIVIVMINMHGNRSYRVPAGDFGNANEKAGMRGTVESRAVSHGTIIHDRETMMLVPTVIHSVFSHSGGVWVIEHLGDK